MAEQTELGMNSKKLIILLIALITITAQLFIPISMAKRYEDILQTGESYLFKVEPIDPADPFRGRYVVLTFPISRGPLSDLENPDVIKLLPRKSQAYAILSKNEDGFAQLSDIQSHTPSKQNHIKLTHSYSYNEEYFIRLPFNRYYAEETKAPAIESLVWNRDLEQTHEFHADVRIKNGDGVIAELYINNTPILEYLEQH